MVDLDAEEYFYAVEKEETVEERANRLVSDITEQVLNKFNESTGESSIEVDYIREYMVEFNGDEYEDTIENYESLVSSDIMDDTDPYTIITDGLVELFSDQMGIVLDLGQESIYFSDMYDIYTTLILDIKNTLLGSYCYSEIVLGNESPRYDFTTQVDKVQEYIFDEELSITDTLLQNALNFESGNVAMINIIKQIDIFVLFIDNAKFKEYVDGFINPTNTIAE